jgi:N-terminal domain of anti-restriction factor ArdC
MDVYGIVTEKIIALLENGIVPWRRPWTGVGVPRNLVSMKPYRGLNYFLLSASKYISPYWLTMRQANELGGHVRRGEESRAIVFWKVDDARGDAEDASATERDDKTRRRFLLRYYRVWNVEQCELPAKVLDNQINGLRPFEFRPDFEEYTACSQCYECIHQICAEYCMRKKACGTGIRKKDLLRGRSDRIPDPLCLTFPGKPGKDRRYCTRNKQYKRCSAQSITQPFGASASIVEQHLNYVTNEISEHAHGQKRNREMVNNRMQMVLCNENFHGHFRHCPFRPWAGA